MHNVTIWHFDGRSLKVALDTLPRKDDILDVGDYEGKSMRGRVLDVSLKFRVQDLSPSKPSKGYAMAANYGVDVTLTSL